MTETESRPRNRALVASFLFTDLVGYSKGTASDQYAAKETLSEILRRNLAALRKDDYRIKDTGDGCLIAFLVNPEHALYIALAIAHDFAKAASAAGFPSNNVRTGLHIGAVKEAIDLEARPNFVGDGINAAKRIMDFAEPGQITASRAYFEAVSWLDSAYAALFQHLGASDDKHGRPHELYAVAPSDAVLEKLRQDLGGAAQDVREADKAAAPPSDKPAGRATSGVDASAAAGAKPAGGRKWVVPVAAVAGIAIAAAIASVVLPLNRGGAGSGPADSRTGPSGPPAASPGQSGGATAGSTPEAKDPAALAQPASDAKTSVTSAQPASDAKASAMSTQPASDAKASAMSAQPGSDAKTPVTSAQSPSQAKSSASPAPPAANPKSSARAAEPTPASAASKPPAASVAAGANATAPSPSSVPASASAPASARCRYILEKVQVGEPLSQDEKRELASSCR